MKLIAGRSWQAGEPFQNLYVNVPPDFDNGAFRGRHAQAADYDELLEGPVRVFDDATGKLLILHLPLEDRLNSEPVVEALERLHFPTQERGSGSMVSQAVTVGFLPRIAIRRDFCTATGLAYEHSGEHATVCAYVKAVCEHYREWNPELYARHAAEAEGKVDEAWRIEGTPFTSGIVNKNSALPYHFDSGNFKDVWSAMLVFKRHVAGGHLCVPALRLAFDCPHNSMFGFDGQGLLHGVTPIRLTHPEGVRYSIVFYTLAHMWDCLPPTQERERIAERRRAREKKRLKQERAIRAVADLKYQPRFPVYVLLQPGLDVVKAGAALVLLRSGIQPVLVGREADCRALARRIGGSFPEQARLVFTDHATDQAAVARRDAFLHHHTACWLVDAETKKWELEIPELGWTAVTPNAVFQKGEQAGENGGGLGVHVQRRRGAPRVVLTETEESDTEVWLLEGALAG